MFSEHERKIFKYHNGEKWTAADPMKVYRRLVTYPGLDLRGDCLKLNLYQSHAAKLKPNAEPTELGRKIEQEGVAAFDRLVTAARAAFNVKDFDLDDEGNETGLMDEQVMELLMDYMLWLGEVKKNTLTQPTSPNSTALTS